MIAALLLACVMTPSRADSQPAAEAVIVVTLDGFRWQEFFSGADETLLDAKSGGVRDVDGCRKRFWRESAQERREALIPFFWKTIAREGQIFGNPALKSVARSTNGLKFSYPGYSEIFCGVVDPTITSNSYRMNPNISVLEYLHQKPAFQGRVEAICAWDVFGSILRSPQSGFRVLVGWNPLGGANPSPREQQVNRWQENLPRYWKDCTFDSVIMAGVEIALDERKPRVLAIALGETDEWGHGRRYDLYLNAAHNADQFLAKLWQQIQADPARRDRTTLLITTDHGRGPTRIDWTDHGSKIAGAENIWMAALGAGVPARGERRSIEVTQGQIAATVAKLLGEDFLSVQPKAAPPLPLAD